MVIKSIKIAFFLQTYTSLDFIVYVRLGYFVSISKIKLVCMQDMLGWVSLFLVRGKGKIRVVVKLG